MTDYLNTLPWAVLAVAVLYAACRLAVRQEEKDQPGADREQQK